MVRLSGAIAALAAGAALCLPAAALAGNGPPKQDFVVGGGENGGVPINHFAVNAHSGPSGENPFGEAHFVATSTAPDVFRFNGPVVCLNVKGNLATVVFQFRNESKNEPSALVGDVMYLQDNGTPKGGVSPDMMQNSELTQAGLDAIEAFGCPAPITPVVPLTSGNITINDAQP